MAESVDAADLKSVGIYPVPVQVWPSAPIRKAYKSVIYKPFCIFIVYGTFINDVFDAPDIHEAHGYHHPHIPFRKNRNLGIAFLVYRAVFLLF